MLFFRRLIHYIDILAVQAGVSVTSRKCTERNARNYTDTLKFY